MSATLTRSSLDSYLSLNVQNSNSVSQNNLQVNKSSDNGVDFAKALSILTSTANKGESSSFKDSLSAQSGTSDIDGNYFLSQLSSAYQSSANDESEAVTDSSKSSLEERFSVLNSSPKKEEWELLEKKPDEQDYSILSKLGDGLLTAAKFAASAYLGKVI